MNFCIMVWMALIITVIVITFIIIVIRIAIIIIMVFMMLWLLAFVICGVCRLLNRRLRLLTAVIIFMLCCVSLFLLGVVKLRRLVF